MYLAFGKINGKTGYFIRESYRQADHYLSRDLLDLGADPGSYIVYPGGNSFYIDQVVEEKLTDMGTKADPDEIEDIFWPFVHPEIQRVLEPFRGREKRHQASRRKKRPENKIDTQIHIFDKRRMHYLRFGQMDQRDIGRLPLKFFQILHNKSRDEIEQTLIDMQTVLSPREYKAYTYVIFDLQQFLDMVLIDLTRPNLIPSRLDNIVENLIWASDGSEVKTVVANGKVLKLDYRFTLLDFETIVKEVQLLSEMLTDYMVAAKKITGTGAHKIEDR